MNKMQPTGAEILLELPRRVTEEVAGDIEKESVYVSPHLERIRVAPARDSATLVLRSPDKAPEVVDKARRYLDVMCRHLSGFDVKIVLETKRRDEGPFVPGVNAKLVERGWVHDYGKGQVAYSGPVLRLARMISEEARALYASVFDVVDAHFPGFVDHETLVRCGYVESHPNQVTFVGNVAEDFDVIEAYRLANTNGVGPERPADEHIHHDGLCLNPAACLPAYPTLEGRVIGPEGHVVTWLGRVFRYESRNISGLDRLYEFNVREIVFVGSEDYVAAKRQAALPLVRALAEGFDLEMSLQSATDPFFATVSAAKKLFQAAHDVKNEILLPVLKEDGSRKMLAGGSINLHGPFFGERFDIRTECGAVAHTGCIGLGVERWVLAAFTQHGFDPDRWPARVRDEIFA